MTENPPQPPGPTGEPAPSQEGVVTAEGVVTGAGVYRVELPTFEGPLDLLLHLIEEHQLDIRDIPIAFVAKKYVEYITLMQEVNIDVASEYLVMAATLAHIKSKTLLPVAPADPDEEDEEEIDPRAELIRRLLEYQKYKHAAERLSAHDLLGRDVFPRGMPAPAVDGPAPIAGLSLFKLLDAFQSVLSRAKATIDHQIDFERFSITDRINELSVLLQARSRLSFDELFEDQQTRAQLIVTFLALLEMTRLRMTRLFQEGPLEMIYVELAVSDDSPSQFEEGAAVAQGSETLSASERDGDAEPVLESADREEPNVPHHASDEEVSSSESEDDDFQTDTE
ncbi:MAG: segregation and condensation protein A [Myxococcota bacterium]